MKREIQEIIKNLKAFTIPAIPPDAQLSDQEKENFFYFLTAAELSTQITKTTKEEKEQVTSIKKVKTYQNYENDCYNSFQFYQEKPPNIEQEIETTNINLQFNNVSELKQFLKQSKQNQCDEITNIDQKIIQSLNIIIQSENNGYTNIIETMQLILFKESGNSTRYEFYLDKFCILLRQRIQLNDAYLDIQLKFINSIPKYCLCVFELIKELAEQSLFKQQINLFDQYIICFKNLLQIIDDTLKVQALKIIVQINHKSIIDFMKLQYDIYKELLDEEALNKIQILPTILDQECALNFIFQFGCNQIVFSKHAKILTVLLQKCSNFDNQLIDSIFIKIKKLRENEKTQRVFQILSQSITQWKVIPINILELFLTYFLQKSEPHSNYLFACYFCLSVEGGQYQDDQQLQQIIEIIFNNNKLLLKEILYILENINIQILANMMLNKSEILQLQPYLLKDESRVLAKFAFKRFIAENDNFLKSNQFELLKIFLDLIKEQEHTKEIVDLLLQNPNPIGLVAGVMLNCINNTNATLSEEMKRLLEKPACLNNEQIRRFILKYKSIFPQIFEQIICTLDENTKQRIASKGIL